MPMAFAPEAATSCTPNTPKPPEAPHTSTLSPVEGRYGLAEPRPDAVVIDAAGHHEAEHLILADRPGRHDLDLHGGFGGSVALLADRPGIHLGRHLAERRDFAEFVEVFGAG